MLVFALVSCKKNNALQNGATANVSNEEAADLVATSLSSNSNGVSTLSDDATNVGSSLSADLYRPASGQGPVADGAIGRYKPLVLNKALHCGIAVTDSVSRANTAGSSVSFSYNLVYSFILNCDNNLPDSLSGALSFNGSFSGPNLSITDMGSAAFTVQGLSSKTAYYVLNGEYKRTGAFQSKVNSTNQGTTSIDIIVSALTVTKPVRAIISGTATITVSGNVPKKGNFSYTGTIVFHGNGMATLTLNGTAYTVNITSGLITKV